MTWPRLWPRSLSGQMALVIAAALFVAQAINFALLLQERKRLRFLQVTGPAVALIVDAVERAGEGRLRPNRGPVRQVAASPISQRGEPRHDIEAGLREGLSEAGLAVGRIETEVRDVRRDDFRRNFGRDERRFGRIGQRRAERIRRSGGELLIAVERPGAGWLVLSSPWPRGDMFIVWRLVAQTLILYAIVLVPVLWATRRISHPLRTLTQAARDYRPGSDAAPVAERGPQDVRDVVAAFNALRLRVSAMLGEKDRMLGAIGHDLRTPLAALRVRIESVEDEADRTRMADTIDEMNRTLDDILSLARLGRPSEPLTEVDLAALVDAVVEDFRDLGSDVSFAETPRLTLALRPSLMRRALRNLIENALKYGHTAKVAVTATARDIAITVSDTGPGIPPDRIDDVFDAFTRLETSRNRDTGGAGLGLALARAIVRDAGGDITLVNLPEGGLAATITLPRSARA